MMAFFNLEIALLVVDFIDGPTLLAWKAIGRSCDCYETNRHIGSWLRKRAKCMDRLARFFLETPGPSPVWLTRSPISDAISGDSWLRERSLSLSHDETSGSDSSGSEL